LLGGYRGATPKFLESKLAGNPEFFCEVIRLIYRSEKEEQDPSPLVDERVATSAWGLLSKWKILPGTQGNGSFDSQQFTEWLKQVRHICNESGHLKVALLSVGKVLIHAPADPEGVWMHFSVASALNDCEANAMREGYLSGVVNSRGVHWVDPTGKPERELAKQFRNKAETIEDAGFQRFAVTLKSLADNYDRQADLIITEHNQEENGQEEGV